MPRLYASPFPITLRFRSASWGLRDLTPRVLVLPCFKTKNRHRRFFCFGRGRRTRTLKNGFGDRHVTITSYPYFKLLYLSNDLNSIPQKCRFVKHKLTKNVYNIKISAKRGHFACKCTYNKQRCPLGLIYCLNMKR